MRLHPQLSKQMYKKYQCKICTVLSGYLDASALPKTRPGTGCLQRIANDQDRFSYEKRNAFVFRTPERVQFQIITLPGHWAAGTRANLRWSTRCFRNTPDATACVANVASTCVGLTEDLKTSRSHQSPLGPSRSNRELNRDAA